MKDTCLILNSLLLYFQISSPFFSTLVCVLAQEFQLREKGTGAERIRNDSIYFLAFCKFPLIATVSFQRSNFFFFCFACSLWSFSWFWFSSFGKWKFFPLILRAKWALNFSESSLEFHNVDHISVNDFFNKLYFYIPVWKVYLFWKELKLNW